MLLFPHKQPLASGYPEEIFCHKQPFFESLFSQEVIAAFKGGEKRLTLYKGKNFSGIILLGPFVKD